MLPMGNAEKYELVVMLGVAGLGFIGSPYYVIFLGAVLLTISALQEQAREETQYAGAGATRLLAAGGLLATAVISLAFAGACFAVGRIFSWLVAP